MVDFAWDAETLHYVADFTEDLAAYWTTGDTGLIDSGIGAKAGALFETAFADFETAALIDPGIAAEERDAFLKMLGALLEEAADQLAEEGEETAEAIREANEAHAEAEAAASSHSKKTQNTQGSIMQNIKG